MHGQQTLKHLNEKAVADAIMAKHKPEEISPALQKELENVLAKQAKQAASQG